MQKYRKRYKEHILQTSIKESQITPKEGKVIHRHLRKGPEGQYESRRLTGVQST